MSAVDWAALTVSIITITAAFAGAVRWLVKHYLYELKPNGGGSVKDQVNRLEARVDEIYLLLCEKKQSTSSILYCYWNVYVYACSKCRASKCNSSLF